MHAVLITFDSTANLDDLTGPFAEYARVLSVVPGLIAKTWLREGATLGGFHLFADRQAAERYRETAPRRGGSPRNVQHSGGVGRGNSPRRARPSPMSRVAPSVSIPVLGGLHHTYERAA